MSGEIDLSVEALREHAGQVRSFMGELSGATEAASDTLDLQTFGIACIGPAQILQIWISAADSYIKTARAAGDNIAGALNQMAASYEQHETDTAQSFCSIDDSMSGGR